MLYRNNKTWKMGLLLSAALLAVACGDDESDGEPIDGDGDGDEQKPGDGDGDDTPELDPVYLLKTTVYPPEGAEEYVLARHDLDFDITVEDLKKATKFAGYTGVKVIDGKVIVADSETPFATKYDIDNALKWKKLGDPLNFSKYFTGDADGLNFYFQTIRGNDVYLFYGSERTSRAHWNVADWKILGSYEDTDLPVRAGYALANPGNRTGVRDWKSGMMQSYYYYKDDGTYATDRSTSYLALYDADTHEEKEIIEVPCPAVEQQTIDEEGNVYFTSAYDHSLAKLYGKGPAACVVKVSADGVVDDKFGFNDLTDITGGFYGVNFRYVGKQKAIVNVLHHDRLTDVDWTGEPDPAVESRVSGGWVDGNFVPADGSLWELHLVDLIAKTSQIVTGFEDGHEPASYIYHQEVDDRIFFALLDKKGTETFNAIYELDVANAKVSQVGYAVGEVTAMRLR